jgi:hypothetical protein
MLIEISSLVVSLASLVASVRIGRQSVALSQQTLKQAKEVADRAGADWRQQQWFTLFFEANAAYDLLERFHSIVNVPGGAATQDLQAGLGAATLQMKKAQGLAEVFPKCVEVDALFEATKFPTYNDYVRPEKLKLLFEAVEGLRQKALVSLDVLGSPLQGIKPSDLY